MQLVITVTTANGIAHNNAGKKSHAIRYQYIYIGSKTDKPPNEKQAKVLTGSFSGWILCPQ